MTRTKGTPAYLTAHMNAMLDPKPGHERAIVTLYDGITRYANAYLDRYGCTVVGDDFLLGPEWRDLAKAFLGLLNGETGRLDCGTLDGAIRKLARDHNVDLEA